MKIDNQFKGTQGKWTVDPNYPGDVQDVNGNDLAVALREQQNGRRLLIFNIKQTTEQAIANAKLISVAPEMLEAMQCFCNRVENGEVKSVRTYSKFKAIIDKAITI